MSMPSTALDRARQAVRDQVSWMKSCGGDLAGYIDRYGSSSEPGHYGDGGEAIYAADLTCLSALQRKALEMEKRERFRPLREAMLKAEGKEVPPEEN